MSFPDTNFVPRSTVITAEWLQAVNKLGVAFQLDAQSKVRYGPFQSSSTDVASFFIRRDADYLGGTPGFVNSAGRFETNISAGVTAFEWALLGVVNNYSSGGEHTGIYGQGNKYGTGPTFGGTIEVIEWTGLANPTAGTVGLEVDVRAVGTDNLNARVGLDVVATRTYSGGVPSGPAMEAAYGVRVQTGGDPLALVKFGYSLLGRYEVGFDAAAADVSVCALRMAQGQSIHFLADNSRKLFYNANAWRFTDGSNNTLAAIGADGAYFVGADQVVRGRITGWGTATNGSKAAFNGASATLAQTSAAVAQLIADLRNHGLIGT